MPPGSRPTTPIRRISRGSLSALSHSRGAGDDGDAAVHTAADDNNHNPTPLSFLDESVGYLSDETSILLNNLADLNEVHSALNTFNEGFAMFLYGLRVAAYCTEWEDSPQVEGFQRAKKRSEQYASLGSRRTRRSSTSGIPVLSSDHRPTSPYYPPAPMADQTYVTQDDEPSFDRRPPASASQPRSRVASTSSAAPTAPPLKSAMRKTSASAGAGGATKKAASAPAADAGAAPKPKITLAQKKKREKYAGEIVETLPLEYRGSDPTARKLAESIVMALISARDNGMKIADIVKPPLLPQAKVNKCLIALTNAKHVVKANKNGIVYMLDPNRHSQLPP